VLILVNEILKKNFRNLLLYKTAVEINLSSSYSVMCWMITETARVGFAHISLWAMASYDAE